MIVGADLVSALTFKIDSAKKSRRGNALRDDKLFSRSH